MNEMEMDKAINLLVERTATLVEHAAQTDKSVEFLVQRAAQTDKSVEFLVQHAAQIDAGMSAVKSDIADIRAKMATNRELGELKEIMLRYSKYAESLMNAVTRGQLSLEDRLDQLEERVRTIEKRNPPQQAA
jgi:predicted  nucleic acid-binding Zn-ribbon protein